MGRLAAIIFGLGFSVSAFALDLTFEAPTIFSSVYEDGKGSARIILQRSNAGAIEILLTRNFNECTVFSSGRVCKTRALRGNMLNAPFVLTKNSENDIDVKYDGALSSTPKRSSKQDVVSIILTAHIRQSFPEPDA